MALSFAGGMYAPPVLFAKMSSFLFRGFFGCLGQGGNFGSEKSAKSDRRRQIFRSAGIRSAEPSNFVGKIGESAKSGGRQNRQIGENRQIGKIGGLGKIGVGSGIGRQSPDFFCRIGSRSARPNFFSEIATLVRTRYLISYDSWR